MHYWSWLLIGWEFYPNWLMPQGEQRQDETPARLSTSRCLFFQPFALPFIQIDPTITKAEKTSYEIIARLLYLFCCSINYVCAGWITEIVALWFLGLWCYTKEKKEKKKHEGGSLDEGDEDGPKAQVMDGWMDRSIVFLHSFQLTRALGSFLVTFIGSGLPDSNA